MSPHASVPGRERFSSLLLPMSSSSAYPDKRSHKRSQSAAVGPSHNVDLLGSGGIILEHEWAEKSELPYSNVPDGWKKRLPPTPPTELEIRDETTDLWHGVEFGYSSPSWGVSPGPLRIKCPPSGFPSRDTPLTLYPGPSTPFFIRAPSWRALLRLLATLNETRIEPTPEAWADMKQGTAELRLVVQFIRTPLLPPVGSGKAKNEQREVALYLCLHQEVPSIGSRIGKSLRVADRRKWSSWDTSVLPYGFNAATGSRLAKENKTSINAWTRLRSKAVADAGTPVHEQDPDGDGSMFVTLPPPLVELPATMSDVALYLQDSLVRSRRGGKWRTMADPNGYFEDPGKSRNVMEKATTRTTNSAVPAPSGFLSTLSIISDTRPSTSRSRMGSTSVAQLWAMDGTTIVGSAASGRGPEPRDPLILTQEITAQGPSPPSPVTPNPSPSHPREIDPAHIPGIKRLAYAIESFYPNEYTTGSSQPSTGEGSGKPHSKSLFEKLKRRTNHGGGVLKTPITRGRERDSNTELFNLITPRRSPGL